MKHYLRAALWTLLTAIIVALAFYAFAFAAEDMPLTPRNDNTSKYEYWEYAQPGLPNPQPGRLKPEYEPKVYDSKSLEQLMKEVESWEKGTSLNPEWLSSPSGISIFDGSME